MSLFQNAHICKLIYSAKKSDKWLPRDSEIERGGMNDKKRVRKIWGVMDMFIIIL